MAGCDPIRYENSLEFVSSGGLIRGILIWGLCTYIILGPTPTALTLRCVRSIRRVKSMKSLPYGGVASAKTRNDLP